MRAMILQTQPGSLRPTELPVPEPGPGQALIRVSACGVCRTDLHIIDGELTPAALPLVPGHQVVGRIEAVGEGRPDEGPASDPGFAVGDRVGVPWLGWTCGGCRFCRSGRENLCERARFTGYTLNGGYAEFMVADQRFCFGLGPDGVAPGPDGGNVALTDPEIAPLLCAGMIGHRAFRIATDGAVGDRIGLYGFGSAAHILCQVAVGEGRRVFAFTRPGDDAGQAFALELGAEWAGSSEELPPERLDAAIIFAPVGDLMIQALRAAGPGARVVSAGIHMSDIPAFPYADLWEERSLHSVANLTREDGTELLALAARHRVKTRVETFPLEAAGEALERLRAGVEGSLVLDLQAV